MRSSEKPVEPNDQEDQIQGWQLTPAESSAIVDDRNTDTWLFRVLWASYNMVGSLQE
jgi:hypothetical protein